VGFVVWSLAAAATGMAQGFASLLALRLMLGMTESIAPLASITYIRRSYEATAQGLPTSIYIAGQMLGPALGSWLGTLLLARFGWRVMFLATGLCALVWVLPWILFAPKQLPAIEEKKEPTGQMPPIRVILAQPGFWAMTCSIFLLSYLFSFILTWLPSYLRLERGFTALEMGRIMLTAMTAMGVVTMTSGYLADRISKRTGNPVKVRLLFGSLGLIGAGTILLLKVFPGREAVLPILLFSICSSGIGNSTYWQLTQLVSPAKLIGRSLGYLNTLSQMAGIAAPLITGWLLGPSNRFGVALLIAGLSPLLAGLILLTTGPRRLSALRERLSMSPAGV
jgi:MFS family permease